MKKATSSLLIPILLVMTLIIAAVIIFNFEKGFVKNLQGEQGGDLEKACLSNVEAKILSSCYDGNNQITTTIQNIGVLVITSNSIFRIDGNESCIAIPRPFREILPFETQEFSFITECNSPETITFVPNIEFNGENKFCDISSVSSKLEPC